jgi:phage terminase Nu1 subunit (DNA packaging protein)
MKSDKPANPVVCQRYVNERAMAELSGLAVRTLQQWRLRGNIRPPWRKLGGAVRYDLTAFQAWVDSPSGWRAAMKNHSTAGMVVIHA